MTGWENVTDIREHSTACLTTWCPSRFRSRISYTIFHLTKSAFHTCFEWKHKMSCWVNKELQVKKKCNKSGAYFHESYRAHQRWPRGKLWSIASISQVREGSPSNASGTAHTVGLDWTNHWIAAHTPYEYVWKIPPPEMKHKSINMSSLTAQ